MKKSRLLGAAVFCFISITSHAAAVNGQGIWETTLEGRDLDGNLNTAEAYYDTVLDITWLADAYLADSAMSWDNSNNWAAGLNPYGSGITGWRLPIVNPIDGTTADDATPAYDGSEDLGVNVSAPGTLYAGSTASEMAHMFYNTLGNLGLCIPTSIYPTCTTQSGYGLANTGPFIDLQPDRYWSSTEFSPGTNDAWLFYFNLGDQDDSFHTNSGLAWAVHDGDVGTTVVPIPAALWLFSSGLLGLIGMARKKST